MSSRLHHLDAVRSACMLLGLLVHGNVFFAQQPFQAAVIASDHFRMALFFLVSGLLVAMVGHRVGARALIRRRSLAILLPLLSTLVLLNPITNYLVYIRFNPWVPINAFLLGDVWREEARGPGSWLLHLWFLVSLECYVLVHPAIARLLASHRAQRLIRRLEALPREWLVPVLAAATAVAVLALRIGHEALLNPIVAGTRFDWICVATLVNLPFFALGMLLHASPRLLDRFQGVSLAAIGLSVASVLARRWGAGLEGHLSAAIAVLAESVAAVTITSVCLALGRGSVRASSPIISLLSGSMYTIYLVHYFLIFAIGLALAPIIREEAALYVVIIVSTAAVGLLLHVGAVQRSPLLLLLLNGRRRAVGIASPPAPTDAQRAPT